MVKIAEASIGSQEPPMRLESTPRRVLRATPENQRAPSSVLVELSPHERFQFLDGLKRVLTLRADVKFATGPSGQHHHPHDALAVDGLAAFFDVNFTVKTVGRLYKQSSWPGVDAQLIGDHEFFRDLRILSGFPASTH